MCFGALLKVTTDFHEEPRDFVRPHRLENWGEARRLKAVDLRDAGFSQREIASNLGVSCGAVSQWLRRAELEGRDSLRHKRDPGRARRLSDEQAARLTTLLARSPREAGFWTDEWTRSEVRDLILREFGVAYHLGHVSRLLRAYGVSFNKPSIKLRR